MCYNTDKVAVQCLKQLAMLYNDTFLHKLKKVTDAVKNKIDIDVVAVAADNNKKTSKVGMMNGYNRLLISKQSMQKLDGVVKDEVESLCGNPIGHPLAPFVFRIQSVKEKAPLTTTSKASSSASAAAGSAGGSTFYSFTSTTPVASSSSTTMPKPCVYRQYGDYGSCHAGRGIVITVELLLSSAHNKTNEDNNNNDNAITSNDVSEGATASEEHGKNGSSSSKRSTRDANGDDDTSAKKKRVESP